MKTIKIYSNIVLGGWSADSLENRSGGSEEKMIELAKELAKDNKVIIYHNGKHGKFEGVEYQEHLSFKPYEPFDVFISFKNRDILKQSINAKKIIHFTTEIENWKDWELEQVDKVVTISDFHTSRMMPKSPKIEKIYLWADFERLERNKVDKEEGSMLYCSSLDRGLEQLLSVWGTVMDKLKLKKLYITYGWNTIDLMIRNNPKLLDWKNHMLKLMEQKGIEFLGQVSQDEISKYYWKSQYWCLPLNNPDSELFCINAIKSEYCNSIPLVRRIGALTETVNNYLDFDGLLGEKVGQDKFPENAIEENRKYAQKFNLKDQVQKWRQLIN
jgi:hypothetical protein